MPFVKGAPRPPNAGRKKGTPNKITTALREEVARTGKTALQVMMDNMRVAYEQATMLHEELLKALAENKTGNGFERKLSEMWNLRDRAQRYARDVAPYFHPQLQAIKHDHRTADGAPLRPILVIEGYPSEPPKAVTGNDNRH